MSRAQLRMVLVLAGILPTLVAVAFAVKVLAMLSHDRDGRDRFDTEDYVAAAGEFSANGSVNWFESWIAAFDEGAARHADGDLEDALDRYATALEDVPAEEECTVRINAALAHETLGDEAVADDPDEATAQWQAGIDVLAEGECPTDAGRGRQQTEEAAAVDQRLRDKVQQQQQQDQQQDQQDQQDQQQDQQDQQEQREQERKEGELEERNNDGIEEQQDHEDRNRERDYSQYQW